MSEVADTPEGWAQHARPPSLFRRFQFASYSETSGFLERLETLSKETEYYPDISFGTTYANVTVHARDGQALGPEDSAFARRASGLASPG